MGQLTTALRATAKCRRALCRPLARTSDIVDGGGYRKAAEKQICPFYWIILQDLTT